MPLCDEHKPGDEKRSVVIVRPDAYQDWLSCRSTDEVRSFLNRYQAEEMAAEDAPIPKRAPARVLERFDLFLGE